jgi:hypothetical protein
MLFRKNKLKYRKIKSLLMQATPFDMLLDCCIIKFMNKYFKYKHIKQLEAT